MNLPRRTFSLLLALTPGIGGRSVMRVLARCDVLGRSAEEFLKLGEDIWRAEFRLSAKAVQILAMRRSALVTQAVEIEERLSTLGVTLVTAADAHYPALIEEMNPDPPGVLFLYGNIKLLDTKTFCVLSSRGTRPADLEWMEKLAEEGVMNSEVLVTGHDRPEYQRTAIVPLRWGSPRILCLDRGMFKVLGENLTDEAFRAARLWRYQFDPTTDLVVSPFRPDADYIGINNKVRDALVASLSKRLVFVQVAPSGGMEKLVRQALKCGRKVQISDHSPGYRHLQELGAEILRA